MLPLLAVAGGAFVIWQLNGEDQEEVSTPKKVKRKRRKKKVKVIESPPSAPLTPPSAPQEPSSEEPVLADVPPVPSPAEELPAPASEPFDSVDSQSQTKN